MNKAIPSATSPTKLLNSLLIPAIIMPFTGWMLSVSLPIIRDDFAISADVAAWIVTAFSLPFLITMPVYGRLSDGLGKRRLLLWGIAVFLVGTLLTIISSSLGMLLIGRIIQGLGISGMIPLSLALITEQFPVEDRGRAMGIWSTVGPIAGVLGPIFAGLIVAYAGWRSAFIPSLIFAAVGFVVIFFNIPMGVPKIDTTFLQRFDWLGVGLLSLTLTFFFFYLSSRPITGVPALQDWRLFLPALLFLVLFVWYERSHQNPFLKLAVLRNSGVTVASLCAALRMVGLSGAVGFLVPLYLADVVNLDPTMTGLLLMANPAAMILTVRYGGRLSDRLGSRSIVMVGFTTYTIVLVGIGWFSAELSPPVIAVLLFAFGSGGGLMLASLHRAALNNVPDPQLGAASGIYSMIRFIGSAFGAAYGGILLQFFLDRPDLSVAIAYRYVFFGYAVFCLVGITFGSRLAKGAT